MKLFRFFTLIFIFCIPLSAFAWVSCFREVYYEQNPSEKWRIFQWNSVYEFFLAKPFDLQELKNGASSCDTTTKNPSDIRNLQELKFANLSWYDMFVFIFNAFIFFWLIGFFFLFIPCFCVYKIYYFEFSENMIVNTFLKTTFVFIALTVLSITLLCIWFFIFILL